MRPSRLLGRIAVVSMLVLPLAACASSGRISSKQLCEASGGSYSGKTCSPKDTRSAEQMCQAHGGVYMAGEDFCNIPIK